MVRSGSAQVDLAIAPVAVSGALREHKKTSRAWEDVMHGLGDHPFVSVIGGGLAGSEAAWQAAERGVKVKLYEMRPELNTPAHRTANLGEIVCSNSLKSDEPGTAPYLLKEELRRAGSLLIRIAHENSVPAGTALAVDRERFSDAVTRAVGAHPNIELIRREARVIPEQGPVVVATGPLT